MTSSRNERERACFILNPRSAGGATGRRVPAIREAAERHFARFEIRHTERPGHASELAADAEREGFDLVVAVGGDGTASEVVNGLLRGDPPPRPKSVFTVLPAGTGSDLIRSLRIPRDLDAGMAVVATGTDRATDALLVELSSAEGSGRVRRAAINVSGFGMTGEVVRRANESTKRWGGTLTFLSATLASFRTYVPPETEVSWVLASGERQSWQGRLMVGFAANGAYCGGGMCVGRGGSMQDGLIDLTVIPALPLGRLIRNGPRLYTGALETMKDVIHVRVTEVDARTVDGSRLPLDVDGEQPGVAPLHIRVLPTALLVRGIW